jgi:hypothetical protein
MKKQNFNTSAERASTPASRSVARRPADRAHSTTGRDVSATSRGMSLIGRAENVSVARGSVVLFDQGDVVVLEES